MTTALICLVMLSGQGGETKDANGQRAGHKVENYAVTELKKVVGKPAPNFQTVDYKGQFASLQKLRTKPVVLVFIERSCPCCKSGKPYFDRIQNVYGDVANVVGVVTGTRAQAAGWRAVNTAQFNVVADPGSGIAKKFHAGAGLYTYLVGKDGKIALAYPGYSQSMLRELTAKIAKMAKVKDGHMEVRPAPTELTVGCGLEGK